jgi:hypothetical protein
MTNQPWRAAAMMLCVLVIAGEAAAAEMCIDVDLRFEGRAPSPATVQSMQEEASAIWQPYGTQIHWPSSRSDAQCPGVHGSFSVLVRNRDSSARHASALAVLGSTHVVPASIDHAGIDVDYDETLQALQSLPQGQLVRLLGHFVVEPADVGRALGRVLAHEIGHVVLSAPRHQASGLMRPSFDPADLVTPSRAAYTLSKKEIERLGQRECELREYATLTWAAGAGRQ